MRRGGRRRNGRRLSRGHLAAGVEGGGGGTAQPTPPPCGLPPRAAGSGGAGSPGARRAGLWAVSGAVLFLCLLQGWRFSLTGAGVSECGLVIVTGISLSTFSSEPWLLLVMRH